eukprot:2666587-Karenia_brevis.AAC.1
MENTVSFNLTRTTPILKARDALCQRLGLVREQFFLLRLGANSGIIRDHDTVDALNLDSSEILQLQKRRGLAEIFEEIEQATPGRDRSEGTR